jgi:signal peptidase I
LLRKVVVLLGFSLAIFVVSLAFSTLLFYQNGFGIPGERYHIYKMGSASMEPTILKDHYVLADTSFSPENINAAPYPDGDIIIYEFSYLGNVELIVHRAVAEYRHEGILIGFITKGDNSFVQDAAPVPLDRIVCKIVNKDLQVTQFLGLLIPWFWIAVAISIATGLSSLAVALWIWRRPANSKRYVEAESSVSSQKSATLSVEGKYCRHCGARNKPDAVFCENCGKDAS